MKQKISELKESAAYQNKRGKRQQRESSQNKNPQTNSHQINENLSGGFISLSYINIR